MKVTKSLLDNIVVKQLKWYGHIQRMAEDSLPKQIMTCILYEEREKADQKLLGWMEFMK